VNGSLVYTASHIPKDLGCSRFCRCLHISLCFRSCLVSLVRSLKKIAANLLICMHRLPTETPVKMAVSLAYLVWVWTIERLVFKKKANLLEMLYLLGLLMVSLFYSVIHPLLFGDRLPFLPLMLFSVYCSLGVLTVLGGLSCHILSYEDRLIT